MKTFTCTRFFQTAFCLSLLGIFSPLSSMAQGPGSVRGSLQETNGQALPFADVLVLRAADSTLVTGVQTTENGSFAVKELALGTYIIRTQALSYQAGRSRVVLTAEQPSVQLPALKVAPATTKLAEVVVQGQKETVVESLDKKVINVEKDLGSVGGTAVNVLQNVPSVAVDARGTVSMRGSSNLTILIDGKPSGTSNGGNGPRLDQIPASQIAQVEIMTNPSAKYDASGAGVINIITKKQKKNGFNGQAGLVVGTRDKYSPSLSLSRRQGKANWNLNYSGRDQVYLETRENQQLATLPNGSQLRSQQNGSERDHSTNHRLSLGLDYELSPNTSLGFNLTPGLEGNREVGQSVLTQHAANGSTSTQKATQELEVDVKVMNASTNLRHTWAKQEGRELSANAGWVRIDAHAPVTQTVTGALAGGWRQDLRLDANIFFAGVDYVHPLAEGKGRFEAGAKVQAGSSTGGADMSLPVEGRPGEFVYNAARSMKYTNNEVIPAAYLTYQRPLGHGWSTLAGLRSEYTAVSGELKNQTGSYDVKYLSFFPSATLAKELGEKPGQQKVQASYARRLNRPDFMQQLPFAFYQDPLNYRTGNPALRAEFSHNVELGHQITLTSGATFTTTLFGRFTDNAIQSVRAVDEAATAANNGAGLVTAETYRNLGTITNLGAEFTWNQPLAKWWRVAASGSLFRNEVANNAASQNNRSALAGTLRLNNNFQPTKTLDVQLTGSFRSATLTGQGRQLPTGGVDIALRQRLFQDRAALTLRVSDIFDTQVRNYELNAPNLQANYETKYETRVGWLGFTWYLGASKPGKRIETAPQGGGGFGG
ncbi:TonB-dependent receptor [Hymenobacter saemangeumensis]|uniref:TonB-dependent receptor n=1 Tax=Hymenobacter saemangeumensis TaxID=1084522 RepID=A0ABP8I1Y3_9BACT